MSSIEVEPPSTPAEKDKAVANAVKEIEKTWGEGSIMDMQKRVGKPMPCIPTGIYGLDYDVLGIGGLPKGRIIECFGPESGGKSTLALLAVASAQKAGGRAAYIDVECALDANWCKVQGVDVEALLIAQPDWGEQALNITETLLQSQAFDIIVVDSVAALVPKAELDGEYGDSVMGLQARMMSQAMRKMSGLVSKSNCVLLFINQIREKIGVMFGSPETTTGGRALKFYASVRLDVRRISTIKDGDKMVGNLVRIKGAKNKCSAPFRQTEVPLLFDRGFDVDGSVFDAAVTAKIIEKSGSWFSYQGERLGQGRDKAVEAAAAAGKLTEILASLRSAECQSSR